MRQLTLDTPRGPWFRRRLDAAELYARHHIRRVRRYMTLADLDLRGDA